MNRQRPQVITVTCRLAVALMVCATGCAPTLQPHGPLPDAVPAPDHRAGDAWTYVARNGYNNETLGNWRYAVAAAAGGETRIAITRSATDAPSVEIATADGGFREHALPNLPRYRFDPPFVAYGFPLAPGRSWDHTVSAYNTATQRSQKVRVLGWVTGWERIRVPAGEFDTLKIARATYAGDGDFWRTQTEIYESDWFAPQIGAIIKHEERSQWIQRTYRGHPLYQGDRTTLELIAYERIP